MRVAAKAGDDGLVAQLKTQSIFKPTLIEQLHGLCMDQPGLENGLSFELRHQAIITRFGRYPHRNALLGRASSADELAFLSEPGSSF